MFSNDSHNITVGVLYGFTGTWGLDRVSEHISVDGSIYFGHQSSQQHNYKIESGTLPIEDIPALSQCAPGNIFIDGEIEL